MEKGHHTTKFFGIVTVVFMAIVFLSMVASADEKPGVVQGESLLDVRTDTVTAPVITTDFPATIFGLAWRGAGAPRVRLRLYNTDGWSVWYEPETDYITAEDGWSYMTDPVIGEEVTRAQYRLTQADDITQVKLIYLGEALSGPSSRFDIFKWIFGAARASETVPIITRADWGADEDWRYKKGEEIWQPEYSQPQTFVIHHTAGSDGGSNPAAAIRGIYYWHSSVLGWGDIGYNYLIDQQGNVYEGRAGGAGVIGAHVYRDANCAAQRFGGAGHEANFNPGTIGIAILGDYESSLTLNMSVRTALTDFIAQQGVAFGIAPDGEGWLVDAVYPNVVGHRDLDCTSCPGDNLYSQLGAIRTAAQTKFDAMGGVITPVVKASYLRQSEDVVTIARGATKKVWVEFRNDGNTVWHSYDTAGPMVIAKSSTSSLRLASGNAASGIAYLVTPNVAPGETGRFSFTIQAPTDLLEVTEQFALSFGGTTVSNSTFSITAQVTGFEYAADMDNQTISPATFVGSRETVRVQFKNRGTTTWQRGDIKLYIYDLGDRISRYYDPSWPERQGGFDFTEPSVAPDGLATFSFSFHSPAIPGRYLNVYRVGGIDGLVQLEDRSITRVDSPHQAELVDYTIPPAILTVWRPTVTFTFKNIGISTWDRGFGLQVIDLGGAVSRFADPSWDDIRIATHLNERKVTPGQTGSFTLRIHPPPQTGLYFNLFRVFKDGLPVFGGDFSMITRVD